MKNEIQKILRKWEGNLRRNGSMDATRFSQVSNEIDSYIRTSKNTQVVRLLTSCRDSTLSASPNNDKILRNVRHALFLSRRRSTMRKENLDSMLTLVSASVTRPFQRNCIQRS